MLIMTRADFSNIIPLLRMTINKVSYHLGEGLWNSNLVSNSVVSFDSVGWLFRSLTS